MTPMRTVTAAAEKLCATAIRSRNCWRCAVNRASSPSKLKITDMRYVTVEHMGRACSIIRLDTNQDIYGYGEVRDGGEVKHALMLKNLLLGQNPCNVEKLMKLRCILRKTSKHFQAFLKTLKPEKSHEK